MKPWYECDHPRRWSTEAVDRPRKRPSHGGLRGIAVEVGEEVPGLWV